MVKIRPIIEGDLFQFRIWIKTLPLSINEFAGVKLDHICYLCLSEWKTHSSTLAFGLLDDYMIVVIINWIVESQMRIYQDYTTEA